MRELTVYYCPKCGRYAYYQIEKNTTCPRCEVKMSPLSMSCQEFTKHNREERETIINEEIIQTSPSIAYRILAADRIQNDRNMIRQLQNRVQELEQENRKLNETVEWMHQTIWDLLTKSKSLERQLSAERGEVF